MAQEIHASFTLTPTPRRPEVSAGNLVSLLPGEYSITNAHSGLSLKAQPFGRGSYLAEDKVAERFALIPTDSGYFIRTAGGYLKEREDDFVQLAESGTVWRLRELPATESVEICGASGRVLEVDWRAYGSWAWIVERSGGSNQEWRIEPWKGSSGVAQNRP